MTDQNDIVYNYIYNDFQLFSTNKNLIFVSFALIDIEIFL